jgi:hypothetical protein
MLILLVQIARFLKATTSSPGLGMVATISLYDVLFGRSVREAIMTREGRIKRWICVVCCCFSALLLGMFMKDIVLMIGFGGAIGGWLLTFLLPSACRVKL